MDEDKKKVVMIVLAISCLVIAGGIVYYTNFRGPGGKYDKNRLMPMMCMNPKCGHKMEITMKEFREKYVGNNPQMMMPMMGPMAYECPECGKKTLMMANKCPQCDEIFPTMMNPQSKDYPDRCPKCGHSKYEEAMKARKKK